MSRLVVAAGVGGLAVATAVACGSFGDADDDENPPAPPAEAGGGSDAPIDAPSNEDAPVGDKDGGDGGMFEVTNVATTGVSQPFYMTLAATELVFGRKDDVGGVYRVSKSGGMPTKIGTRPAWGILSDGLSVYYCDPRPDAGSLMRVGINGNNEKNLLPDGQSCLELTLGNNQGVDKIYFTTGPRDTVERLDDAGSAVVLRLAGDLEPEGITADTTAIYYAGLHEHAAVKIPYGGSYQVLDGNRIKEPRRIAVDADFVYWVEHNSNEIRRVKKDGSDVAGTIAVGPALTQLGGIAVDANHVYWVVGANPGGLYRVDKNGGPYETLVDKLNTPVDVVLDLQNAYVTVYGENRIIRVNKK